jgi:hypothetical protein
MASSHQAGRRPALRATLVAALTAAGGLGMGGLALAGATGAPPATAGRSVVVRDADGDALARVPVQDEFAVSYRNSIYGTLAEERYRAQPDGSFRLVQIAADQLAVLEEYYGVPDPPHRAPPSDRRTWVVDPDVGRPLVLERLSIAATDLGERTLHVPGTPPTALWRLVEENPTVVLDIEENP